LLNFQKSVNISFKIAPANQLFGYLNREMAFFWLHVSIHERAIFSENQISHVHLKPNFEETMVKGEDP